MKSDNLYLYLIKYLSSILQNLCLIVKFATCRFYKLSPIILTQLRKSRLYIYFYISSSILTYPLTNIGYQDKFKVWKKLEIKYFFISKWNYFDALCIVIKKKKNIAEINAELTDKGSNVTLILNFSIKHGICSREDNNLSSDISAKHIFQ